MQIEMFKSTETESRELPQNYRDADPESSEIAAKRHEPKRGSNCAGILEIMRNTPRGALTSLEICEYYKPWLEDLGVDRTELSRRLSDLAAMGQIKRGPVRMCKSSGKRLASWKLID